MNPLPTKIIRLDRELMIEFLFTGLEEVETKLNYVFKNKLLLIEAALKLMTHHSYKKNCLTDCSNELEWLGDRVLGKLIHLIF